MDGDKMNNEVINRHKRRWYEGETDSESSLNQAIENFNELLDIRRDFRLLCHWAGYARRYCGQYGNLYWL